MRLTKWAARLYPGWWRERYGEEFAALIEDARPGIGGALDIARGAVAMQMRTWSAKRVVALGTLAGIALGLSLALLTPKYESVVVLSSKGIVTNPSLITTIAENAFSGPNLVQVVRNMNLYQNEGRRDRPEDVTDKMRKDLSLVARGAPKADGTREFELRFRYVDRAMAQKAAARLEAALVESGLRTRTDVRVLTTAQPAQRLFPNLTAFAVTGFASGLLLTGIFALGMVAGRRQLSIGQE
jgi:hypothetical protein